MKASVLFGAGWERATGSRYCGETRNGGLAGCCGMAPTPRSHAFIPIPPALRHPTLESVNRLTHEHNLQSYLDGSWAMRPLELVRERGQPSVHGIRSDGMGALPHRTTTGRRPASG